MSSSQKNPFADSRLHKHKVSNNSRKLKTPLTSPIKRSLTETHMANKRSIKQDHNQQSLPKDEKNRTLNPFQRHFSLNTVIKFKNSTEMQKILTKEPIVSQFAAGELKLGIESNKKQKLLEKIPDHRRIRSTSKISSKIIEISDFFNANGAERPKQRVKSQLFPKEDKQQNLQKLLQLKLKTQSQSRNLPQGDLISYRNTIDSNQLMSRTHYGIHIPLKSKLSDILTKKQINKSKQLIQQNEQMRISKNLMPRPKQWQFHNCLVLQRIQLYSTNLKISCEGWVTLDHLQLKYLRGWNPKMEDDFSPLIRLFIAKIAFDIPVIGEFGINIDKIFIRVNDRHIYEDQAARRKDNGQKLKGLAPHTILSLKQLITICTITKHNDLIVHAVLALGYLLQLIYAAHDKNDNNQKKDPLSAIKDGEEYNVYIKTTDLTILQDYCSYFQKECENIAEDLDLPSTKVSVDFSCLYKYFQRKVKNKRNEVNQFNVVSSSLDIAVLFMKCLGQKQFRQILSYRAYQAQIKYQMGWSFWQTRTQKWLNSQYSKYHLKAVGGRNNKGNQSYVAWDDHRDIIIAIADSKANMHWRDAQRIQQWIQNHISRFSKHYNLQLTFFPTDTQKFLKIN